MAQFKIQYHSKFGDSWNKILSKLPDGKSDYKGRIIKEKDLTKSDYKRAKKDIVYYLANGLPIKGEKLIKNTKDGIRAFKCHLLGNKTDDILIAWRRYKGTYSGVENSNIVMIIDIGNHDILDKIKDMKFRLYENEENRLL